MAERNRLSPFICIPVLWIFSRQFFQDVPRKVFCLFFIIPRIKSEEHEVWEIPRFLKIRGLNGLAENQRPINGPLKYNFSELLKIERQRKFAK